MRSYSFWTLSSYWSFMIDARARTIYDDMVGLTFEHSVDCLESLRISTRCDVPISILGHIPYLSESSGFVSLCKLILVEIFSHILIFRGFITSLSDGIDESKNSFDF